MSAVAADFLILAALIAFIWGLKYLLRGVAVRMIHRAALKSKNDWDDLLIRWNAVGRGTDLIPLLLLLNILPLFGVSLGLVVTVLLLSVKVLLIYSIMMFIDALLNTGLDMASRGNLSERVPVKAVVQVLKLLLYFSGGLVTLAVLLDKDPAVLLSGLGAMTAVLMLIFKDAILGFVAGVQLLQNRMVNEGDWIEMPKYNADGDVEEIALTTVKVRNFDKTVTTIPSYALISDSFRNWRSMPESGGRRIKRSVSIDMQSIRFCDMEMLQRYEGIPFIGDYVRSEMADLSREYSPESADRNDLVKGRHLTNLGVFRAYIKSYLQQHPEINTDMTLLVRQLAPGSSGVPLEIYAFSRETAWLRYEDIQSDIFDHILAMASEFDLKIFQSPSGRDIQELRRQ